MELDKIESPTEYINAITKLLPYSIGKVKPYEEVEHFDPPVINIHFLDTEKKEEDYLIQTLFPILLAKKTN